MTRPMRALFVTGVVVTLAGLAACAVRIYDYLSTPRALSSTSGLKVFYQSSLVGSESPSTLVQYAPFVFGAAPVVLVAGLVLSIASVALAAALWRPRM